MYIADATELIQIDQIAGARAQTWCDLGCETGTFTLALATLLPPGSVIHAIDKDERSLSQIPKRYQDVTIRKEVVKPGKERSLFACARWRAHGQFPAFHQTPGGFHREATDPVRALLVVEYDGRPPSPWVPYPLGFSALRGLLLERGFSEIAKLGTRASRFGGELYSALAEWQDK